MPLSFGVVVACNNLLALKNFSTFLANYELFEKPSWFEKFLIRRGRSWIESKSMATYKELSSLVSDKEIEGYTLKDFDPAMFGILMLAHKKTEFGEARNLFMLMSATELQYAKLKNPRCEAFYKGSDAPA